MATCTSAESVIESANLIREDASLIHKFTHGTDVETVELGSGDPTPTLRKLVRDARVSILWSVQEAVDSVIPAGVAVAITQAYIDSLFE